MSARLRIVLMAAAAWLLITLTWGTYRAVGSGNSHGLPIVWVGVGLLLWGATAAGPCPSIGRFPSYLWRYSIAAIHRPHCSGL